MLSCISNAASQQSPESKTMAYSLIVRVGAAYVGAITVLTLAATVLA